VPPTPYRIETPRVLLRVWDPADAAALSALIERNLGSLRRWLPWARDEPLAPDARLREVRRWRSDADLDRVWRYAVVRAEGGELAGGVTLFHRLGTEGMEMSVWYERALDREVAEEASAAAIRAALEAMEAPRVFAACDPDDGGRAALWRGLGFAHDGTLRRLADGRRVEEMLWSLLPGEWPASRAAALAADARAFDALENRLF
jgi:RimJ/RimL family protein N-acetyltransferase